MERRKAQVVLASAIAMAEPCCPTCRKKIGAGAQPASLPFCSPRCKLVDLGKWLGDSYVIAEASFASDDGASDLVSNPHLVNLESLLRDPS